MSQNIFDIIGPIMIGPSSSHTAGAARIGNICRELFHRPISKVDIYLHGSFSQTYKGHGTDKALVGGLLGFAPDDPRIRNSFAYAAENDMVVKIQSIDLGHEAHPNSVQVVLYDSLMNQMTIRGSSLGGGRIVVTKINGFDVMINGEDHLIVIYNIDKPGVISRVTGVFSHHDLNIGTMNVARKARGAEAVMSITVDRVAQEPVTDDLLQDIKAVQFVNQVIYIKPV